MLNTSKVHNSLLHEFYLCLLSCFFSYNFDKKIPLIIDSVRNNTLWFIFNCLLMWCIFFFVWNSSNLCKTLEGVKPSTKRQVQFSPTKIRNSKNNLIKCIQQSLKIRLFKHFGCLHSVCNMKKIGQVRAL